MNSGLDLSGQHGVQTLIILLLIVGFVVFRMLGERRIPLSRLWLMPAVLALLSAASLWESVQSSWLAGLLALVGAVLGWLVGELTLRTQQVRLDPQQSGVVWVRGSLLTVVIFLGSFALRMGLRVLIGQHALHGLLGNLSGALLAFSVALIAMRNYGVYRAALRLRPLRS